jgi:4-hydroxy-2-oxoheptanedioate aldolase
VIDLPVNRFKAALVEGRHQLGLWSSLPDPIAVEALCGCGYDWLLLDTEHAPNDLRMVALELMAAKGLSTHPIVRVRVNDAAIIKQYMDAGAQTILVPMVNSAAEARAAARAMRLPPDGIRGVAGMTRATSFARVKDYGLTANAQACCLVQVETREAVEAVEEIAAVEGVDGIFIGPNDLAASYGFTGQPLHPEMQPVIEDTIRRIRKAGKPAGILTFSEDFARKAMGWGTQFTAVGADFSILLAGASALAARFRG